jgi:hypothetical protein
MSQDCCRPRVLLSEQEAQEIFKLQNNHGYPSLHSASVVFSKRYGVSPKAIRDIWTGRSWLEATFSLWNEAERPARRTIGRPKGSKDSKPRKSKERNQSTLWSQGGRGCIAWDVLDNQLRFSRSSDSAAMCKSLPGFATSVLEDYIRGPACLAKPVPTVPTISEGLCWPSTVLFNPYPGISPAMYPQAAMHLMNSMLGPSRAPSYLGGPSSPFFNPISELTLSSLANQLMNRSRTSYVPSDLGLPPIPLMEMDVPRYSEGWGLRRGFGMYQQL